MEREIRNNNIIADSNVSPITQDELEREETLKRVKEKYGVTPAVMMPAFSQIGVDPATIKYLVLIDTADVVEGDENNDPYEVKDWMVITGRQAVFDYLKNLISGDEFFNVNESFIISFEDKVSEAITVFRFMKHMIDSGKVIIGDIDFDIDSYYTGNEDIKLGEEWE